MNTPSNEDQKVAEWLASLGFVLITDSGGDKCWFREVGGYTLDQESATFFYKAQQADRKRLLDKVENNLLDNSVGLANEDTAVLWDDALSALDQIRKEEL